MGLNIEKPLVFIAILSVTLLVAASITVIIVFLLNRRKTSKNDVGEKMQEQKLKKVNAARHIAAPDGINPNPMSYMVLDDCGRDVYVRSFTVDILPKRTVFASTFPSLFNFGRVATSIFIEPLTEGKASHLLDNTIVEIETNIISAEKNYNRNMIRKLNGKLRETEAWASRIETGENRFYHVYFLFTLMGNSLEELNYMSDSFRNLAKEKQIGISCCYGVQPEAFLTGMPLNYRFDARLGPVKSPGLKRHTMDKLSIASIFNHTQTDFNHEDGIILGRNMATWKAVRFDCYDPSHNGYNVIFSGMTGTGKSATIKILASRCISKSGYRFVAIDSQAKGDRGEYSMLADVMCGINYQIKAGSDNIINPFEIVEEEEWSELNGDYMVLRLQDKITEAKSDLMILIQGGKEKADFQTATYIERIVTDIICELYEDKGIKDNDVGSLYEHGKGLERGIVTSGRVKKKLPTLSDFYKKVLIRNQKNTIAEHTSAYRVILDSLKDRVRELYYCPSCLRFFTKDEYRSQEGKCNCDTKIVCIQGVKNYYDGQSTITILDNIRFTNIDISQLPSEERMIGRLIGLNFVNERFIKRNAINPKKMEKLGVICDEVHENFNSKLAVESLDNVSRTSRKRLVSLWTATQALKDYARMPETEALLKQAAVKFIFKQDYQDKAWIREAVNLTTIQVERLLELGGDPSDKKNGDRKGEVCIVDNSKVCFCKVDYLKSAEAVFVETDPRIIQKMYA